MNIYTFDILTNHCISVEDIDEADRIGFYLHHLETGPLKLPEPSHWKTLKEIAAYNVSKCISSNSDIQNLNIPMSLHK